MTVYVITGTRRGIGLEYVRQLAQDSSNTIVAIVRDRTSDLGELQTIEAASDKRVRLVACDVSSSKALDKLGASLESVLGDLQINILINNAAINHAQEETSLTITGERLLSHLEVNVVNPARVLQAALPMLAPGAIIANISSGMGSLAMLSDGRIPPHVASYSVSKAAVNMLTVHQAYDLRGRAIVACFDPGHVKTEMGGPKAVLEISFSAKNMLARIAALKPEDSGKFFLYTGEAVDW